LRSLSDSLGWRRQSEPAFAGAGARAARPSVMLRGERARRGAFWSRLRFDQPLPRGVGLALSAALLIAVAAVGAARGGQYAAFVAQEGGIGDFLARGLGFGVNVVTLTGQSRLTEPQILKLAGITPKDSLPFFDVEAARDRLEKTPLLKQASVRKLYPSQIVIDVVERTPAALWQRDGEVRTVAADGAVIDELRDTRLDNLPFVVGAGANERLGEFLTLLDAARELKTKIAAGVFIGGRRWNFKMKSGLDVKLPENDPEEAVATLLRLQRQSRILDRDILWLDLRTPGRVFARLSADAAAARQERFDAHAKKGAAQ
jgi:cell division protein FtsQ